MDKDSTINEPVAYMYGDTYYDKNILKNGFDYVEKGIEKHPNRLDMRFGKIYMFGQIEDYENFTNEIIKTIDYSATNKNKWTWADNRTLEDSKIFMLASIQDYQLQLYNTEKDTLLDNMKRIAETVLKYYPDHVESLSNLSIVFMLQRNYDKALDQLFKAQKINPKDYIVLSNIAQAYKLKGDKLNAIKYYEMTIKYGDKSVKRYAKEQIDELKK
jgi:tetratricopeptide (TPR) repeat protein